MPININVPDYAPQPPQFPQGAISSLVENYLNRPTGYQVASKDISQGVGGGLKSLVDYQLQQQQRKLQAIQAVSELYGQGGPGAVQQYLPMVQEATGVKFPQTGSNPFQGAGTPGPSQAGSSGNPQSVPQTAPANGSSGGGVPMNASQVPAQPPANLSGQSQPTMGYQPPQQSAPMGPPPNPTTQPSEHIINSVNQGAPDFTGHLQRINQLQGQMAGFANQGKYGQTQTQQVAAQIGAEKQAMDAEMLPSQYEKTQQEINLQKTRPMAEEVSKQTATRDEVRTLNNLFSDLQSSLSKNQSTPLANISGKIAQATGGRLGSATSADVQNAAAPLATLLNTVLARRFNSGEVALLSHSLVPQPGDTPQYAATKMTRLKNMLNTMSTGSAQDVTDVGRTLMTGSAPTAQVSQGQSAQPQAAQGRITVKSPSGQIGHIPRSQLKKALSMGYTQQ